MLTGTAVLLAGTVSTVTKVVVGRARPYVDLGHGKFKPFSLLDHYHSFPSGHTIAAFSVATVFANRYRKHRWVPYVAYGLAGWVGFTRVSLQSHFVSDVFAGAALGYVLAHNVTLRQP